MHTGERYRIVVRVVGSSKGLGHTPWPHCISAPFAARGGGSVGAIVANFRGNKGLGPTPRPYPFALVGASGGECHVGGNKGARA